MEQQSKVFLVHFFKKWKYLDFCLPELEALADMHGIRAAALYHEKNPRNSLDMKASPCVYVNLPNEQVARQIQERSVLIKEIISVLSQANKNYEELVGNVDLGALQAVISTKKKFRFLIEGVGKKISQSTQREVIAMFGALPFDKELVDLENYELAYKIIENASDGEIYFGNRVASCRSNDASDETFYAKYNLKLRPYLGPTSTDHELALLMANQGQVRPGDFVYDPFVGTGSIAAALQHFNSLVFGSDLDIRVIKGYGVGRKTKNDIKGLDKIEKFDIMTNFTYYGMPHPDFWVQDVQTPMLRTDRPVFDAIVCDPPYGVRARTQTVGVSEAKQARYAKRKAKAAEKTGSGEETGANIQEEAKQEGQEVKHEDEEDQERKQDELDDQGVDHQESHTEQIQPLRLGQKEDKTQSNEEESFHASMKRQYEQKDIYSDLLQLASRLLRPNGRIAFLYHTDEQHSEEENRFPEHPDFDFICSSKDTLTRTRARHLITMRRKVPEDVDTSSHKKQKVEEQTVKQLEQMQQQEGEDDQDDYQL